METPELQVLNKICWQFFATLTFKGERLPERVRLSLFFALLHEFCAHFTGGRDFRGSRMADA